MLDVHAPHEPMHTWKAFLIHIATIVVGLFIAVGLEQSVEALHHRHEGMELRAALRHESEQISKDSQDTANALGYHEEWLRGREKQVKAAVWRAEPLKDSAPYSKPSFDYPDDPVWRSAKLAGLAERLTGNELKAYSEVELLAVKIDSVYDKWRTANSQRLQFERQFPQNSLDPSTSPADLRAYLGLLTSEAEATSSLLEWDKNLLGAERTILTGDLDLERILAAEKRGVAQ